MAVVILTGFMATGKTEVGRKLAALLGAPFVDTDALVESATGRAIADIFARDGEPHFRALEREAVERACAIDGAVVATGGGTLLDPENRRRLAAAGPVVCLTAAPDEASMIFALAHDHAVHQRFRHVVGARVGCDHAVVLRAALRHRIGRNQQRDGSGERKLRQTFHKKISADGC